MKSPEAPDHSIARGWLLPLLLPLGASLLLLVAVGVLDFGDPIGALRHLWSPGAGAATNALAGAGEIVAGVLAVAVTVVAIVVELASTRYSHRITALFVRDPRNALVIGYFVVTAVIAVCASALPAPDAFPLWAVRLSLFMLLLSLLLLLPYFAFVFTFVNPMSVVNRMRQRAVSRMSAKARGLSDAQRQAAAIEGIDHIADMAQNALENRDKGVAVACVDTLGALVLDYQGHRADLGRGWFKVDGPVLHDLDFVSLSPEVLSDISSRRIWLEMKVLRRYNALFSQALGRDPDLNHLVAIRTRALAECTRVGAVIALGVKFFNTYLRAALNASDRRAAYNVLQQYRLLAEHSLSYDDGALAIRIGQHLVYYAREALRLDLAIVVETIAYDFGSLVEAAYDARSAATPKLLKGFLSLDQEVHDADNDEALRGVRKAQIRLATFFMERGSEKAARRIHADMKDEPPARLRSIRADLLRDQDPDFWEINDRGVNFEYLSEQRKERAREFFGWFGTLADNAANSTQFFEQALEPVTPTDGEEDEGGSG